MQVNKLSLLIPALMLVSAGAFADQSAVPPQGYPPAQSYPPPQDYGYQGGYQGGYGYQNPCGSCGPQLPQVYPAPGPGFDPGANYYCDPYAPCAQPVVPYGPPPVVYTTPPPLPPPPPVIVQPGYYGRPAWPRYGARPFVGMPPQRFGGPVAVVPHAGPPPPPGRPFHHISAEGCAIWQGNSHSVSVVLPDEKRTPIYTNSSEHAYENAVYMKAYYEKSASGICGTIEKSNDALDI